MLAIRFARAFRRRALIVKFEGSYHGSYDDVSWSVAPPADAAGKSPAPRPRADTAGLAGAEGRLAVLPFNDVDALADFIEVHGETVAALLVEPMANRMGLIMPDQAFIEAARSLCDRFGIVLIFDEVIAFRIGYSGAQGELGVTPDLVSLGKVIGGGFPVGAVAGRADILELSSPGREGRVTHAGTFNGNPMVGAAGRATMELLTPDAFDALGTMGARVRRGLGEIVDGLPLTVTGAGSLFKVTATGWPIRNYADAATADVQWEKLASLALLNAGFLVTPGLSGCVSTVTSVADVDAFLSAFRDIVTN